MHANANVLSRAKYTVNIYYRDTRYNTLNYTFVVIVKT